MGVCASCGREQRQAPEKRWKEARAKGAAAGLLPARAALNAAMANSISNIKMTNPIKGIVSKRRKRYIKDGFNLDLAYITDRLIAMGFPAEKLEGVYRNHIDEVYRFLEAKHKDHYKIYNLCSERSYDSSKFHERVERYAFEDHSPPEIEMIQPFCEDVHKWLSEDQRNVAAVHCKAGKGRTGTMLCCYLLYSGQKATAEEALNYYGTTRTHDEKGVTIPSQRRYVSYYGALVSRGLSYRPAALHVRELRLAPAPPHAPPHALALCVQQPHRRRAKQLQNPSMWHETNKLDGSVRLILNQCTPMAGDVRVEVYAKPKMKRKEKLFHFWFNTFFVVNGVGAERVPPPHDSLNLETFKLTLNKWQLDDAHKDKQHKLYHQDFKVELIVQKQPESSRYRGAGADASSPSPSTDSSCSDDDEHWDSGERLRYDALYDDRCYGVPYDVGDTADRRYDLQQDCSRPTHDRLHDSGPKQCSDRRDGGYVVPKECGRPIHDSRYDAPEGDRHYVVPKECGDRPDRQYDSNESGHYVPKECSDSRYEHESDHFVPKDCHYDMPKEERPYEPKEHEDRPKKETKPRLSLGDMRASWREFSGRHFGNEHSKGKKRDEG